MTHLAAERLQLAQFSERPAKTSQQLALIACQLAERIAGAQHGLERAPHPPMLVSEGIAVDRGRRQRPLVPSKVKVTERDAAGIVGLGLEMGDPGHDAGLEARHPTEPPHKTGQSLDKKPLHLARWRILSFKTGPQPLELAWILARQDDVLGGQSVPHGVATACLLSGLGPRSGALARVGLVGADLPLGCHRGGAYCSGRVGAEVDAGAPFTALSGPDGVSASAIVSR